MKRSWIKRLGICLLVAAQIGPAKADDPDAPGYDIVQKVQDIRFCLMGLSGAPDRPFDKARIAQCMDLNTACSKAEKNGGELMECFRAYRDHLAHRIEVELDSFDGPGWENANSAKQRKSEVYSSCMESLEGQDREPSKIICELLSNQTAHTQVLLIKNLFGKP